MKETRRADFMKLNYNHTIKACFAGYIVQAVINNFVPLLFVTFGSRYGIPLSKITMLITLNFTLQLCVDFASAFFVDKIGYRASAVLAHAFSAVGLIFLAILPDMLRDPFAGIITAVFFYAIGGGLLEVIVSPIVEACPSEHKDKTMSMLHSFYCWGTVGVIVCSTVFFTLAGIRNWKILSLIWSLLPIVNGAVFAKVPLDALPDGETEASVGSLFKNKTFWVFVLIMCCAGASEQSVSQWASAFVEKALGISKSIGDLAGPAIFSVLMGISRMIYGKYGEKINLDRMMIFSGALCIASYLVISLSKSAAVGLVGIAAAGFSVGILWPGTFSKTAGAVRGGGTAMFAFLALAGDVGCAGGPTFAGKIASLANDNLKTGILAAVIFPVLITAVLIFMNIAANRQKSLDK